MQDEQHHGQMFTWWLNPLYKIPIKLSSILSLNISNYRNSFPLEVVYPFLEQLWQLANPSFHLGGKNLHRVSNLWSNCTEFQSQIDSEDLLPQLFK